MTFHLVGMEAEIAKDAFSRSLEKCYFRYTNFVGVEMQTVLGKSLTQMCVGITNHTVEKMECVITYKSAWDQNWETWERNVVKDSLQMGKKAISGWDRLTEDQVKSTQQSYGNAIRDNEGDLKAIREAIWAVFFHKSQSDEQPFHNFCLDSWRLYEKIEKEGTLDTYKHTNKLSAAVTGDVKPIFKDLSKTISSRYDWRDTRRKRTNASTASSGHGRFALKWSTMSSLCSCCVYLQSWLIFLDFRGAADRSECFREGLLQRKRQCLYHDAQRQAPRASKETKKDGETWQRRGGRMHRGRVFQVWQAVISWRM